MTKAIDETPAMVKIGSVLDYLLRVRGVNKCWTLKAPCKGVDEGDRLAALLVRSRFALALHESCAYRTQLERNRSREQERSRT